MRPDNWNTEWPETIQARDKCYRDYAANSLQHGAIDALNAEDPNKKVAITRIIAKHWFEHHLSLGGSAAMAPPARPGRPETPSLQLPTAVKKRSIRSAEGRIALIHAIAHIELNAMDLAWDIIARFCHLRLPRSFFDGWVQVAFEEAKHFSLLRQRLIDSGRDYGDLPAHDGLWQAAQETEHDLAARLAIVPLVLEARGLDISPSLIRQLEEIGDEATSCIFNIIYRDEKSHVAIGAKWFRFFCQREGREPAGYFQYLVRRHFRGALKPPFNDQARARAGIPPLFYRALSASNR